MAAQKKSRRRAETISGLDPSFRWPPGLREDFGSFIPVREPTTGKRDRRGLSKDQIRYILWRRAEGEPTRQIATKLQMSRGTVLWAIERAFRDAHLFVDCMFVVRVTLGRNRRDRWWLCRFCNYTGKDEGTTANHAFGHLFNLELAMREARIVARIHDGVLYN